MRNTEQKGIKKQSGSYITEQGQDVKRLGEMQTDKKKSEKQGENKSIKGNLVMRWENKR